MRRVESKTTTYTSELTHKTSKSLVGTGDATLGIDLNQDIGGRMNVDLEFPNLIQGAIQQRQQLLMQDIRSIIRRVLPTLLHHGLMVIAVEQTILPTLHFDGF